MHLLIHFLADRRNALYNSVKYLHPQYFRQKVDHKYAQIIVNLDTA